MTDPQTAATPRAAEPGDAGDGATEPGDGAATSIAHDCEPESVSPMSAEDRQRTDAGGARLIGIDVARCLALLGMMVVHVLPAADADGTITTAWSLTLGKSAALFAVVAGVGVALSTGRRQLTGRTWAQASSSLLVRALLIGALGLLLGRLVSSESALVILPYYALLFVFAIPLLRLSTRWVAALTVLFVIGMPITSHLVRETSVLYSVGNPSLDTLLAEPANLVTMLLLSGQFPALSWIAYIGAGLAIGRSMLFSRSAVAGVVTVGIGLAVAARVGSWLLLEHAGGRAALEAAAPQSMTSQDLSELLVFGADGVLPTTSPWWLAVSAPHTTTPFDLLFTIGVAFAVLGAMVLLGRALGGILWPLAAAGSMPLTLYTAHLLLLEAPFMPDGATTNYVIQVVVLLGFALLWRRDFSRGPLEEVVRLLARGAGRLVSRRRDAARPSPRPAPGEETVS